MREHIQAKRKNRSLPILLMIATAFVLAGGWYFLARPHITQALAERRVKEIVANFNASAKAQGSDLVLAYEAVKVDRERARDVVTIVKPTATFNQAEFATVYTTANLHIIPKNIDFGAMVVEVRDTLEAKVYDGTVTHVEHANPLVIDLSLASTNAQSGRVISYDAKLPASFEVKRYSAAPAPETLSSHSKVEYDAGAGIKGRLDQNGEMRESALTLKNLRVTEVPANTVVMTAAAIDMNLRQAIIEKTRVESLYQFSVESLDSPSGLQGYGPFTVAVDAVITGNVPDPSQPQASPLGGMTAKLSKLELRGKNAAISGKGEMKTVPEDSLPVGEVQLTVQGFSYIVQEMASHGLLSDGQRALLQSAVQKITGTTPGTPLAENVVFVVKREKGGQLMIGQATVDDLMALYLSQGMSAIPGLTIPQAETDEPEPEATPIPEGAIDGLQPTAPVTDTPAVDHPAVAE